MIHSLIIRPSRVELVLKTYSADFNKFSEKKLISKEFTFRFNREIIDTGAYYKSLYRILADILQPYKKDIQQLQISLRSSFFQVRSIKCEEIMYSDKDYLNWEVDKTINDVSEHFNYGTLYEDTIKTLHLFIVRKSVKTYFYEILRQIISEDINFSIGYDFITESKDNVFISTDKSINKPFGVEQSSIKMWNIPTEKIRSKLRFKRILISTIVLSLLLAAFYLTYFHSESLYKFYTNIFDNKNIENNTIAELPKVKKDTTKTSSEEKFLEKLFEEEEVNEIPEEELVKVIKALTNNDALDSLISCNPRSIVFEKNKVLVQFFGKESLNKFIAIANKYNIDIINKHQEYLSFQLVNSNTEYLTLTQKGFNNIRRTLKLDSKNPFIVMNSKSKFFEVTDILQRNEQTFDKFVLSNRGNKLFLAVYFD